jgi:hypothetical protein
MKYPLNPYLAKIILYGSSSSLCSLSSTINSTGLKKEAIGETE